MVVTTTPGNVPPTPGPGPVSLPACAGARVGEPRDGTQLAGGVSTSGKRVVSQQGLPCWGGSIQSGTAGVGPAERGKRRRLPGPGLGALGRSAQIPGP